MRLVTEGFLEEQDLRLLWLCKLMITSPFVRWQASMQPTYLSPYPRHCHFLLPAF